MSVSPVVKFPHRSSSRPVWGKARAARPARDSVTSGGGSAGSFLAGILLAFYGQFTVFIGSLALGAGSPSVRITPLLADII